MTGLGMNWYGSVMERIPLHDLTSDELLALVLRLQERLEVLEVSHREQAQRIERRAKRIAELEKENHQLRQKNPTQRLEEAYSSRAGEQRREAAPQNGVPSMTKQQKSERRGRISTDYKLALATRHEDIWPRDRLHSECHLRYSRAVWRIINGQAVLVAYRIHAGLSGRVPPDFVFAGGGLSCGCCVEGGSELFCGVRFKAATWASSSAILAVIDAI